MNFRNRRGLREEADRRLAGASYDPRKLMLIYTGATALLMLVVTVLNYILDLQIDTTGGLSGLGMRTMLQSVAEVVQMAVNVIVPFWSAGFAYTVLRLARGEAFGPGDLLAGFRHWGPVLRLLLYRTLTYFAICFASVYLSLQIFMFTPMAAPILEMLEPYVNATSGGLELVLDNAVYAALEQAMVPWLGIFLVVLLIFGAPTFYGLRMADFALMDDPKAGAMAAVRRSRFMMRGNRIALFKLDLGFWWFYLLDGMTLALCYGELILSFLGIQLPIAPVTAYFLFYVLYLAAQLALYVWMRSKVECTYALAYDEARQDMERRVQQFMERQKAAAENAQN